MNGSAQSNLSRKPSSILTGSSTLSANNHASSRSNASLTPRNISPIQRPQSAQTLRQAKTPTVIRATLKPHAAQSVPNTPDARYSSSSSEVSVGTRARNGSASLHHPSPLQHSRSNLGTPIHHPTPKDGPVKIKARLSGVAHTQTLPHSPTFPPARERAPSMTSSLSNNSHFPDHSLYPITTASPAANPHRFAPTRHSPPSGRHLYQPYSPSYDDLHTVYRRRSSLVDPAQIPLPAHSPPTSTVSYSSRSSVSKSSVSFTFEDDQPSHSAPGIFPEPISQTASRDSSQYGSIVSGTQSADSGLDVRVVDEADSANVNRKHRAEAKTNRKVWS